MISRRDALRTLNAAVAMGLLDPKVAPLGGWEHYGLRFKAVERRIVPPLPLDQALALIRGYERDRDVALSARATKMLLQAYMVAA